MDFLSDLVGVSAVYICRGWLGHWSARVLPLQCEESFDFLVFQLKPLYTTSNVPAIKSTLLQCKCPSKVRHSEVLAWNKEGKDEDKLPAQGDGWGGQCHPRTGHKKLKCFQELAELRHWASPGDSWLYVGGLDDILRCLPSHPSCASTVGYLTVLFLWENKRILFLIPVGC